MGSWTDSITILIFRLPAEVNRSCLIFFWQQNAAATMRKAGRSFIMVLAKVLSEDIKLYDWLVVNRQTVQILRVSFRFRWVLAYDESRIIRRLVIARQLATHPLGQKG